MKYNLALIFLSLIFTACSPVEEPAAPQSQPEEAKSKTIGPVVTIHCVLTSRKHKNFKTTGTYFTYDIRTIDMPTREMLEPYPDNSNIESFKKSYGSNRLTSGIVELPIKQADNKFNLDVKNIWYRHGSVRHFFEPIGGWKFTTTGKEDIWFGERREDGGFEGSLSVFVGNQNLGSAGIWEYHGLGKIDMNTQEWGDFTCDLGT